MSSPPPVGLKQFYRWMIKEMKVLVPEETEAGYWDGALLAVSRAIKTRGQGKF